VVVVVVTRSCSVPQAAVPGSSAAAEVVVAGAAGAGRCPGAVAWQVQARQEVAGSGAGGSGSEMVVVKTGRCPAWQAVGGGRCAGEAGRSGACPAAVVCRRSGIKVRSEGVVLVAGRW